MYMFLFIAKIQSLLENRLFNSNLDKQVAWVLYT